MHTRNIKSQTAMWNNKWEAKATGVWQGQPTSGSGLRRTFCHDSRAETRMRREISGTSVATAILVLAAGVLLCARIQTLNAGGIRLPLVAALAIEAVLYGGIIYIWCGRFSPRAEAFGVVALFEIRIAICAAAATAARLGAWQSLDVQRDIVAPVWEPWMAAGAFAVAVLYVVRGAILPAEPGEPEQAAARRRRAEPIAAKVAFASASAPASAPDDAQPQDAETAAPARGHDSAFQVLDPRPSALPQAVMVPVPEVEGSVTVPASVLSEQLPPGTQVDGEQVEIPLALVVPRLREGEVHLPAASLDGIVMLPVNADDEQATVELPLALIVAQLPDEVLELPEMEPPSWLAMESELEDIFFAKV